MFKEIGVFDSTKDDYGKVRIPGIVTTKKGTILACCEARKEESDWAPMDIILKRSTDGGETWGESIIIASGMENETTYNNPVMIIDKDGKTIHMIYCMEYEKAYYIKSLDDGQTWSEPREITSTFDNYKEEYDWKVIATGPGHGIQLENGVLLIPIWMALDKAHHPSVVSTICSKDFGETWIHGEIIWGTGELPDPNETSTVQLEDGSVLLNIRNKSSLNRRAFSISSDGISGWTTPKFKDELLDPMCFGSMINFGDKTKIIFSNLYHRELRENLTITISLDGGETWNKSKTLFRGGSAYSDLAISNDESEIYCLYERDNYNKIVLSKFDLKWINE